jgi:hypothetical protein
VTQLLAAMFATFELSPADLKTNMLGFEVVVGVSLLPPSLGGLLLSRTAMFAAFVPAAVELGLAGTEAHGGCSLSLMTDAASCRSATSACNIDILEAWRAVACVALVEAQVTAWEGFVDLGQERLSAWAVRHCFRRKRTAGRLLILWVTGFLAGVMATVEISTTNSAAYERALKPWVSICSFGSFGRDLGLPAAE